MAWPARTALSASLAEDLRAVAGGDEQALRRVWTHARPLLSRVVARQVRQPSEIDELLQEIHLRVWMGAHGFDPQRGSAWTWLSAIARHVAIDHARRQQPRAQDVSLELLLANEAVEFDTTACLWCDEASRDDAEASAARTQCQRLSELVADLPAGPRQCVALAYHQGLTHREVAHHLSLPLGTVKCWLRRAHTQLRDRLLNAPPAVALSVQTGL